jgi:fucose permease
MAASRRDLVPFALALLAFVSLGLPDAVLGVAWPSMRSSFELPLDRLGLLLFAATAGYLTSSFVSGPVTRRLGVGGVLVGSSALVALSAAGFASAPVWSLLPCAAVLAGLGGGAIDACINAFAAVRFPAGRIAWLHASYGVGASLGPLLMTGILAAGLSWRWGYAVLAAVIALMGLGFLRTRDRWQTSPEPAGSPAHAALRDSLRKPVVLGSALLFFLYTGVEAIPGAWAYSLLTESRGVANALAGLSVALYWGSLTTGRLVSGALAHRIAPMRVLRASLLLAPLWGALLWAGFGFAPDLFAIAALGFSVGPVFPLLIAATPGRVGGPHSGNAVGVQVSLASLGWASLPATAGILARAQGLEAVPVFLVGCALAVLLLHEALASLESRR